MIKAAEKVIGMDSEDKCDDKIQEKAANKIYEQIWPILSDRLCTKFEENAENMCARITDYMMHQMDEKPAIILPIVNKMLDIMKPLTNNTEEERKNLVILLEKLSNAANELKNRDALVKANATPEPSAPIMSKIQSIATPEPSAPIMGEIQSIATPEPSAPIMGEIQPKIDSRDFDFAKDGIPNPPPRQNAASGLFGMATQLAKLTPAGAMASKLVDKLPVNPEALGDMASGLAGKLPVNPSALGDMASGLAGKLPVNPSALGDMASGKLPVNPAAMGDMASGLGVSVPSGASGLLNMASKAKELSSGQTQAPQIVEKVGGKKLMKTYKNRLIKKLYGKTRANKLKTHKVSPKRKS